MKPTNGIVANPCVRLDIRLTVGVTPTLNLGMLGNLSMKLNGSVFQS